MFSKAVFDQKKLEFIKDLQLKRFSLEPLYLDVISRFQKNWDKERIDFAVMYDQSLQSKISNRLWKTVDHFPKEMMLQFMEMSPYIVREVFDDLFNEEKDITGRVGRFTFHCDELLNMLQEADSTKKYRHHYHDAFVASLYLMLKFPDRYCLYNPTAFSKAMALLGARKVPDVIPIDNYFTLMRTMTKFLAEDLGNEYPEYAGKPILALEMVYWLVGAEKA